MNMQPLNKENFMKLHDIYMKNSSWIRDMTAPRGPLVTRILRNPGKKAAGSGK